MKPLGINIDLALSFFLHVLIITITLAVARHSTVSKTPQPFIVMIVDNSNTMSQAIAEIAENKEGRENKDTSGKAKSPTKSILKLKDSNKSNVEIKKQDDNINERIEAIKAKKNVEKMIALRKMVDIEKISVEQSEVKSQGTKTSSSISKIQGSTSGDYYSMVVSRIKEQWIYPENIDKDLLAVVLIKIAKDGNITIQKIEKSSGNPLFDRSALRAINKSSPLPPPPEEIEIGVRFYP